MSIAITESIRLQYIKVSQKGATFYLSSISAIDLKKIVDFHFREPYKAYASYQNRGFEAMKNDLEGHEVSIDDTPKGGGVQRALSRSRVREITRYIENDPEAIFPTTVLLAIDTSECKDSLEELESSGYFELTKEMSVSVIDGQHRLAGLFLADDELIRQVEMPVVFMLDVSTPIAAKLFQNINGKQQKVNKSVIFDLFENIPEDQIGNEDDLETKLYHDICVNLYCDSNSPLYRQIKMLGVGGGAISQSFFIGTCKKELKQLRGMPAQERFDILYDYFSLIQQLFPEDWPKPLEDASDEEIDEYACGVLKVRKSQLAKTTGMVAMLRLLNWILEESLDMRVIGKLVGIIDWTEFFGTGAQAQAKLYERLRNVIR